MKRQEMLIDGVGEVPLQALVCPLRGNVLK